MQPPFKWAAGSALAFLIAAPPGRVRPCGASVVAISQFNTYHYRVEILANGRESSTWGDHEENDK